ncbi:unnamed protein product [Mytilus coruscus]|uniref:HSPA12A n=1 Tax=Mytilus coruscus TaxID=42192 RepID=A0A6J8ESQ9_MYTCO|nr:unnamed protein product [Mytilus coruscus]
MATVTDPVLVVAAIDFGSHGSGYAFSFRYEFAANPTNVNTPYWSSESGGNITYKAPSSILLNSKKKFVAFGHDAEDQYSTICENNEQNSWYYLKEFKMKLYEAVVLGKDIRDDFKIEEMNGKKVSAKRVFRLAIEFLKKHLLDQFKKRNLGVNNDLVKWVITVPAIWNDACKQFMRQAAEGAGIAGDKFCIVYEPEAASIYMRLIPVDKFIGENQTTILRSFDPGRKVIVVDAGGGTVDISAQEVLPDGHLKIIHKICGGSWGGEWVNQEYRKLLKKLLGGDVFMKFKQTQGLDYNEMMRQFETAKKAFKLNENSVISTRFPANLAELLESKTDSGISNIIENSRFNGKLKVKRDKLFIDRELFQSFYSESISMTIKEIKDILKHDRCRDVSAVMLVGGFSECPMLQKAVKEALELEVFIPVEGGLSVLKGAVIYGHDSSIVSSRVCNYTYGVSISLPFKEGEHRREKYYRWDNEEWCKHIFHVCFVEGQDVHVGDIGMIQVNNTFESEDSKSKRKEPFTVEIYISDDKKPMYVTDQGCKLLAKIHIDPPNGIWPVYAFGWVELEIAGTEMIGTYVNAETKDRISTRFEFLPTGYKTLKGERERMRAMD